MNSVVAVIADIVGSRKLDNRAQTQLDIERALEQISNFTSPLDPFRSTVGDEFQAVFLSLSQALLATCLVRLTLQEPADLRFGIGLGDISALNIDKPEIQDGPAWWNARKAIDLCHQKEDQGNRTLRTWFIGDEWGGEIKNTQLGNSINAYILLRDQVIGRMKSREKRLTAGILMGKNQELLAKEEKIGQSAVSQTLHRCGGIQLRDSLIEIQASLP